jgi:hypothetical protein
MPTTTKTSRPAARTRAASKPTAAKARAAANDRDATQLIDTMQKAEESSVDAVHRFVDAVDKAFPDVIDDGPRHKIIDAAFDMVEQLVSASNDLARDVVKTSHAAIDERKASGASSNRRPHVARRPTRKPA